MKSLLGRTIGAVLACTAFYFLTYRLLGPIEWLILAVVIGLAFTRIVIDATAEFSWQFRSLRLKSLGGTHYQFQNFTINVLEDESHCRWVATDEIRKIVGQLAGDQALAKIFPSGHQFLGKSPRGYLRDDALIEHLAHATTPQAIKFKNWAARNIAYPANKTRERLGIKLDAPCTDPDNQD
jgi:hypothetical protein